MNLECWQMDEKQLAVSFACLYLCICVFVYLPLDVCLMRVGRECWQMDGKQLAVSCVCLYLCIWMCICVFGRVHDEGSEFRMLANGWEAVSRNLPLPWPRFCCAPIDTHHQNTQCTN